MGARFRLRARDASGRWRESVLSTTQVIEIPLEELAGAAGEPIAYSVTMLDEHGNRIFRRGSDGSPELLAVPRSEAVEVRAAVLAPERGVPETSDATAIHVTSGGLAVGALGSLVGAALLHAERERLASEWNDDARCLVDARTRQETCAGIDASRAAHEGGAIALYVTGGALGVAALVLLAIAPGSAERARAELRCGAGPGELGLACGARF